MTKNRIRSLLAKVFLTLAYIMVSMQWLWVLAIGLPSLIETGVFDSFTPPVTTESTVSTQPMEFSPVLAIAAGAITFIFLILTIVVLIKLPKTISHTGEKIVHQTTEAVIPVITHHKKIPAKRKHLLTRRITVAIQLSLVIVPLIVSFFIPPVETITSQIITTLAIWLAGFSTICFVISWLLEPKTTSRTRSRAFRG